MNSIEQTKLSKNNQYLACYKYALRFIKRVKVFSSEDLKDGYLKTSKPQPKEPRVWGAVIRELNKSNLIVKHSMSNYQNPVGHMRPINVWMSLICK